jgi:MoaA/NifB/PqqE/SkfB family radical SAM enzyme
MKPTINPSDIQRLLLEFTTRCNLRCAYCAKTLVKNDRSFDMPEELLNRVIDFIIKYRTNYVCINGHGETTLYRNWYLYSQKMLDHGIKLGIITNMSRKLTDEETHTFSRFSTIEVSCDTADPELFRRLRGGADLNCLLGNIAEIRNRALRENREPPIFSFSCLLSDQNVFGLEEFVKMGMQYGIEAYNFCNLIKYDGVPVRHITELPDDQFQYAAALFYAAVAVLQKHGKRVFFPYGLIDSIKRRVEKKENDHSDDGKKESQYSEHPDETRDCSEPWVTIFCHADGTVAPCCQYVSFGNLNECSLEEILNGEEMVAIRNGIISGKLYKHCKTCGIAGWRKITADEKG